MSIFVSISQTLVDTFVLFSKAMKIKLSNQRPRQSMYDMAVGLTESTCIS